MKKRVFLSVIAILLICVPAALMALPPVSFWLDAESGAAFTGYNNVQIPADTGTRFSLADDLEPDPVWFYRLQAGMDVGRHSAFVLYAPLLVESTGSSSEDIVFYGENFAAGLTGKICDAYIKLEDNAGGTSSKRTDLGFVPLFALSYCSPWTINGEIKLDL
jgi:hypothetical protein